MYRLVFIFMFSGACIAAQPGNDAVKKELKKFQGKWEALAAYSFDGKAPTDVELQLTSLEVDGDKFTLKSGSLSIKGAFSIDPSKKLKTIDVYLGDNKDNIMRGIYEINGDVRKSCFALPGKDRPDKFRKEKDYMYMEWRQVK
ncbi:MAG: TIGR03067 domain-containing protein [Planctomycetes bacterium]|nr:TIGR03067 domain-containing protein [Planctomycetota bacterium]